MCRLFSASWLAVSAFMVVLSACSQDMSPIQDLSAVPRQTATERAMRSVLALSADTLEFEWSRVLGVRVDDAGNIYVADDWTQSIVKFDSDGEFVGQLGQKGPGPGEFARLRAFDVRGDGTVFAADFDGGTLSVFDSDGRFIREAAAGVSQPLVAVNDENVVTNYFFETPIFRALSDELIETFRFGEFSGDPQVLSAQLIGMLGGYPGGTVIVSFYTGLMFGCSSDGSQRFAMRTIDNIESADVGWGREGGLQTAGSFSSMIGVTESAIYVLSKDFPDEFGVDAYSTSSGEYRYSFPLPDQECGPIHIDDRQIFTFCQDGVVIRQAYQLYTTT
jgi:hypothetical protein